MTSVTIEVVGQQLGDFTITARPEPTYATTTRQDIEIALNEALKRVRDAYGIDN